ncbi:hypothetical protein [Streptomyces sp. UNOC14_S4]|uniref:hypothetical protein n=1 Tax=Streptomyces sp. UNOC14_S4 TaxID=2872340 RepID=UPI001E2A0118|nr:hypothetical protein [Streptomyces sp. UNOC14_S4]MCC3766464.1 hypothetical protein [Streptomyces sp. UNOC14_S4]
MYMTLKRAAARRSMAVDMPEFIRLVRRTDALLALNASHRWQMTDSGYRMAVAGLHERRRALRQNLVDYMQPPVFVGKGWPSS